MNLAKKAHCRNRRFLLLVSILFIVLLLTGCSSSDKKDNEKTFNLIINFEAFRENIKNQYETAPIQISMFYFSKAGNFEYFYTDTPINEETFKVPESAVFFGIIASVLNEEAINPNIEDWVGMTSQFVFNNNHNVASVERYAPFYVADDFKRFYEVKAIVVDTDERIELFFNGEPVDLDERVIPVQRYDPPGPDNVPNTQHATPATEQNRVDRAFFDVNYTEIGTRYKVKVNERSGGATINHFQGMGWWQDRYLILTHSASVTDYNNPKIYLVNTDNNTCISVDAKYGESVLWHPGGGQVIEDYFVFSAVGEDGIGGIFVKPLNNFHLNHNILRLHQRGDDKMKNSATGVTRVPADRKYGLDDIVGPADKYKYIFALVDYEEYEVLIFRSQPVSNFSEVSYGELSYIDLFRYTTGGLFDNIALFTEYNGEILMAGFDAEAYAKSKDRVQVLLFKIMENDFYDDQLFKLSNQKSRISNIITDIFQISGEDMDGRWGATAYFDGKKMHIFMTNRGMDSQEEISYNYW